jgi:hypothetical protein
LQGGGASAPAAATEPQGAAEPQEGDDEICKTCGKYLDHEDDELQCGEGCPEYDAGWKETHPARGAYKCSICHQPGHNMRTCPYGKGECEEASATTVAIVQMLEEFRESSPDLQDDLLTHLDELIERKKALEASIDFEEDFEDTWAPEIAAEIANERIDYMEVVTGPLLTYANENGITINEARPLFHQQMLTEALKMNKSVIRLCGDFNLSVVVESGSTMDDLKEEVLRLNPLPASVELRFKVPKDSSVSELKMNDKVEVYVTYKGGGKRKRQPFTEFSKSPSFKIADILRDIAHKPDVRIADRILEVSSKEEQEHLVALLLPLWKKLKTSHDESQAAKVAAKDADAAEGGAAAKQLPKKMSDDMKVESIVEEFLQLECDWFVDVIDCENKERKISIYTAW